MTISNTNNPELIPFYPFIAHIKIFVTFNTYMNCYWLYIYRNKWWLLYRITLKDKNHDETFFLLTYLITYLPSYLHTYFKEQNSSCATNRFSASQRIPRILCDPKVDYRIHSCPPTVPILSQLDPVHTLTSHFHKIYLNISDPSTLGSPKWNPSLMFPNRDPGYVSPLSRTRYMPRESHSSRFYHPKNTGW